MWLNYFYDYNIAVTNGSHTIARKRHVFFSNSSQCFFMLPVFFFCSHEHYPLELLLLAKIMLRGVFGFLVFPASTEFPHF